jgi:phage tail sheath gpL-like
MVLGSAPLADKAESEAVVGGGGMQLVGADVLVAAAPEAAAHAERCIASNRGAEIEGAEIAGEAHMEVDAADRLGRGNVGRHMVSEKVAHSRYMRVGVIDEDRRSEWEAAVAATAALVSDNAAAPAAMVGVLEGLRLEDTAVVHEVGKTPGARMVERERQVQTVEVGEAEEGG